MPRFTPFLIAVIVICISTCTTFAESDAINSGTIQGKAIEYGKEKIPIKGLIVTIVSPDGKEFTVKTDENGNYKFSNLIAGNYTLKYLQEGFEREGRGSESVKVVNGKNHVVELKMVDWFKRAKRMGKYRILPMLYHVTNNVYKRHNLEQERVDAIRKALQKSIGTALENRKDLSTFAINSSNIDLLETLLLRPDIKAVFTKHLTELPLKTFNNFIKERQHQENQANIYYSTVLLDKILSLSADQRQKVMQSRFDMEDDTWQNVLTKTQKKILMWTNQENTETSIKRQIRNVPNVIIDANIAAAKLKELKEKAEILESDERTKHLVEAIFAAHTEQLGNLNAHASLSLSLAANRVAQKYLETKKSCFYTMIQKSDLSTRLKKMRLPRNVHFKNSKS